MSKRKSYKHEVKDALRPRQAYDRSKHEDKMADRRYIDSLGPAPLDRAELLEKKYFYSRKTYEECIKKGVEVLRFCAEKYGHRISFNEVKEADLIDYLTERKKLAEGGKITARTLAKERSQVSKVFLIDLVGKVNLLPCTAESAKGRGEDDFWKPEDHREEVAFWSMVGARKNEYHYLTKQEIDHYAPQINKLYNAKMIPDMHGRVSNIKPKFSPDGKRVTHVLVIHAKHGKSNLSEILPEHQEVLADIFRSGKYHDYMNPSCHANIHACRRSYAQALYAHYCRNVLELPENELYRCRDKSGRVYDREAVARVAVSLGHREHDLFDTVHNYLR